MKEPKPANSKSTSNQKKKTPSKPATVTWKTRSFEYIEKSKDWYWVLWILGLGIVVAAVMLGNYTFAGLIAMSVFVLSLVASKKPEHIEITLGPKKITLGYKQYDIADYESYRFFKEEEKILFKHTKPYIPLLVVPTGARPPEGAIKGYLQESKLQEDESLEEPFLEVLMQKIGF